MNQMALNLASAGVTHLAGRFCSQRAGSPSWPRHTVFVYAHSSMSRGEEALMTRVFASALMLCLLITSACISHDTHSRALGELNEARHATLQSRHELDAYKKEIAAAA